MFNAGAIFRVKLNDFLDVKLAHGRRADASTKIRVTINQQCLGDEGVGGTQTQKGGGGREGRGKREGQRGGEGFSAFPTAGAPSVAR